MKKLLALLALVPALALAQNYPSPTYKTLTLQNPLAVASGGTNAASASGTALDNITGFSSTGFLTRTGAGAYAFQSLTNGITYANLAQAAANTVLGNGTGSTATLTALAMPSCSTSSSALNWTTSGGASAWTCNTSINASSLGGTAAASYALLASPTFTGTPAAPTATAGTNTTQIATTAFVNTAVTGGSYAGSFTTLAASGAITPSQTNGIVGTTTNNNANAGSVGEYVSASATSLALTNATSTNITSISLTAGDWTVEGSMNFTASGTNLNAFAAGSSTTSVTLPATGLFAWANITGQGSATVAIPPQRFSLASTTTVYLVASANFTTGTVTGNGFIWARRVR